MAGKEKKIIVCAVLQRSQPDGWFPPTVPFKTLVLGIQKCLSRSYTTCWQRLVTTQKSAMRIVNHVTKIGNFFKMRDI